MPCSLPLRRLCSLILFALTSDPLLAQQGGSTTGRVPPANDQLVSPAQRENVATQSSWGLLSLEAAGIETFWKSKPEADGRGVIVLILDSGVDPGQEGLRNTSDGKQKLIDLVDFSGTGDVVYAPATIAEDELQLGGNTVLRGLSKHALRPFNGNINFGVLPEKRFQNGLGDLNFNGKETDNFGVVVFEDALGHYAAIVDTDADSSISDEQIIYNYRERFDIFTLHSNDSTTIRKQLNGGINIDPFRNLVSLVFDDGSHGTHVAGIAGGYNISGGEGFNGVAPGCEMVGIKFADNSAGGVTVSNSMRQAYLYAADLARTGNKPVVANMSFGIGSEIEGQSVMDKWLDSLLAATPNLIVCVSGSNDGPGLSNVGLPGSASRVITSGAALPDDSGRDLFSVDLKQPIIWDFSSRGGELAKPDIVSPGTAVSTVPDFVGGGARYNGTSMSSPYTAGCVAVLLSAMRQSFAGYVPDAHTVKRAIQLSAVPLPGQTPLDQGYGMINIPRAYELLAKWHRLGTVQSFFEISTEVPNAIKQGTAAYFRGGQFPRKGESHVFNIKEVRTVKPSKAINFQAYDLVSDAAWLKPVQTSIYRRGEGGYQVNVIYDESKLSTPGLYSGRIWAYPKSASRKYDRSSSQFELLSSIIVPHRLTPSNAYKLDLQGMDLNNNAIRREFVQVPAGAKALLVTLASRDANSNATARLFDADGRQFAMAGLKPATVAKPATLFLTGEQLQRGIIEIVLKQGFATGSEDHGAVDLTVEAIPLDITVTTTSAYDRARGYYDVVNVAERALSFSSDVEVLGYERMIDTLITSGDTYTLPIRANSIDDGARFHITLSREDYNRFTDITCQVIRPDSSVIFNGPFDMREQMVSIGLNPKDSTTYTLLFRGGLALPDRPNPFRLRIHERRLTERPLAAQVDPARTEIAPGQTESFSLKSNRELPAIPEGYNWYGTLRMKLDTDEQIKYPIRF